MKKRVWFVMCWIWMAALPVLSQSMTDIAVLKAIEADQRKMHKQQKEKAISFALENGLPVRMESDDRVLEILFIDANGIPQYLLSSNSISAESISTDEVYSGGNAGLELDGNGITIHIWDGGSVLDTHQEFDTRVTNMDQVSTSWHATHVGGTLIASGVESAARGMAWDAGLISFDWNDFNAEIAAEAAAGALISNHSYGWLRGWEGGSTWWGDPEISDQEDYRFGFYDETAALWDSIAYAAPYFLMVKSAGNDRDDKGDGSYPDDGPYDCIDQLGITKNTIVVAAVRDIPGGYTQPSDVQMTGFSSWGPADDGRIKPDISANGVRLYSTDDDANDDYRNASGTSMSTPSVAGSVALLQQHHENLFGQGNYMKAATVKALLIHTADETGDAPGPDYEFGWGLMNTEKAAMKLSESQSREVVFDRVLNDGEQFIFGLTSSDTAKIKATLVWTDPPGIPLAPSLDPQDTMLVNDLDLRLMDFTDGTYTYPWKLDRDNPSLSATNSDENDVDNVEMVELPNPSSETTYRLVVDHDGELQSGSQAFSLILSYDGDYISPPLADFEASNTTPTVHDSVQLTDQSENDPVQWEWSFYPDQVSFLEGTDSASQNPVVRFDSAVNYNVSLTVTNAGGSSNETKLDFITAYALLEAEAVSDPGTICRGDSSQLIGLAEGGSGAYTYTWSSIPEGFTSEQDSTFVLPDTTTVFILEVSDGFQHASDSVTVWVNPLPDIELGDWPEELCNEDEPPVQLEASPAGGTYSGSGVTPDGLFIPEEATVGWNSITYTYENDENCISSATDSIMVHDCVGVKNPSRANAINVFPNPGKGRFVIQSEYPIGSVEIFNLSGSLVYKTDAGDRKVVVADVLDKGSYLLRVTINSQNKNIPIIKRIIAY